MSTDPTTPEPTDPELEKAITALFKYVPDLEKMAKRRATGIEEGLILALGPDRAAAVCAALKGEDPGSRVSRQVRSRDLLTVKRNMERLRTG